METILCKVIEYLVESAASGITWDIIKESGEAFLEKFKKTFVTSKDFKDEKEAESFIKNISQKEVYNEKKPLEDLWSWYYKCTDKEPSEAFKSELIDWLKLNYKEIKKNDSKPEAISQSGYLNISGQYTTGDAKVKNIGIQINHK